jgi:hypothetical protein
VASVQLPDGSRQPVVVNVDVRESDPSIGTAEEFQGSIARVNRSPSASAENDARRVEDQQRWWQIGLLVMLVALGGEALVGRRAV